MGLIGHRIKKEVQDVYFFILTTFCENISVHCSDVFGHVNMIQQASGNIRTQYYLTRVSHTVCVSSRHFLFDTSSTIQKTSCSYRETPAIRVKRSCTTFQNGLWKLLLWIREQQAFKLPLSTPEGGPAVFHCCVEHIYIFISQLLFRLERERKKTFSFWRGLTKHLGEWRFLFFIFIYTISSEWRKWNGRQRQPSLETVEFSLLENPIVQIPKAAPGRFFDNIYSDSFLSH